MELGEFPAQRDTPLGAKGIPQIPQGGRQLVGRLVEQHGPLLTPELLQVGPAIFLVHSQKSLKGKPAGGQARGRQRGDQGARSRDGNHAHTGGGALGHQLLAGVADRRGARVSDQSAVFARQKAAEDRRPAGAGVVPVIAQHRLFQPQMIE